MVLRSPKSDIDCVAGYRQLREIAIGEAGALCRRRPRVTVRAAMRQGSPVRDRRCPRNCQRRARGTRHCAHNGGGKAPPAMTPSQETSASRPCHGGAERDHSSGGGGAFVAIERGHALPRGSIAPGDPGAGRRALGQEPLRRASRRSGGRPAAPIARPPSQAMTRWRRASPRTARAAVRSGALSRRRCCWRRRSRRRRGRNARCWSIA